MKYWVGRENLAASERATTAVAQGIGQTIGEMHPAIIVMNTGSYYGLWGDGTDIYGNQQTNFTIFVGAVGAVPVGNILKAGKALTIVTKSSKVAKIGKTIFQKHHIISNEAYKVFKTDLKAMGWKQNNTWNLKRLPVPFHGNHPAYNAFLMNELRMLKQGGNLNLKSMQNLQHQMRLMVGDAYRSGDNLNQYFKNL